MGNNHIFNKETDSEKLAMEIVAYLRKWGMWQDVQIFTGGKCYSDDNGELVIREENHPEKYLSKIDGYDCNGKIISKDYSNPERLLDMTFEGPLYQLIGYGEYEVELQNISNEARHILMNKAEVLLDEVYTLMDEYIEESKWDPAEFDSYEEWLEFNDDLRNLDLFIAENQTNSDRENEFSSREEYNDFLMYQDTEREALIEKYSSDEICDNPKWDWLWNNKSFFDDNEIAYMVKEEFNKLLEKLGLWYESGFSWSLTTYRK